MGYIGPGRISIQETQSHMSSSLNSLKGDLKGSLRGVIRGDTKRSDYSSHRA